MNAVFNRVCIRCLYDRAGSSSVPPFHSRYVPASSLGISKNWQRKSVCRDGSLHTFCRLGIPSGASPRQETQRWHRSRYTGIRKWACRPLSRLKIQRPLNLLPHLADNSLDFVAGIIHNGLFVHESVDHTGIIRNLTDDV